MFRLLSSFTFHIVLKLTLNVDISSKSFIVLFFVLFETVSLCFPGQPGDPFPSTFHVLQLQALTKILISNIQTRACWMLSLLLVSSSSFDLYSSSLSWVCLPYFLQTGCLTDLEAPLLS